MQGVRQSSREDGRYVRHETRIDKAVEMQNLVEDLVKELESSTGVYQYPLGFPTTISFRVRGESIVAVTSGEAEAVVIYTFRFPKLKPANLIGKHEENWKDTFDEASETKFGINRYCAIVDCKQAEISVFSTKEDLYKLSPEKEKIIRDGFANLREYVDWAASMIEGYEQAIVQSQVQTSKRYIDLMKRMPKNK
ncbi:MAG TPA: hypothetical protein VJH90_01175 [archaeon]|nr:hypothetical protein [archaeon]